MKCPVCDENLRSVDKHNVQIDICPGCKGIWLDRGELEKIIEYAVTSGSVSDPEVEQRSFAPQGYQRREDYYGHPEKHDHHDHQDKHGKHGSEYGHKRKKSWLSNLGDIFGD